MPEKYLLRNILRSDIFPHLIASEIKHPLKRHRLSTESIFLRLALCHLIILILMKIHLDAIPSHLLAPGPTRMTKIPESTGNITWKQRHHGGGFGFE